MKKSFRSFRKNPLEKNPFQKKRILIQIFFNMLNMLERYFTHDRTNSDYNYDTYISKNSCRLKSLKKLKDFSEENSIFFDNNIYYYEGFIYHSKVSFYVILENSKIIFKFRKINTCNSIRNYIINIISNILGLKNNISYNIETLPHDIHIGILKNLIHLSYNNLPILIQITNSFDNSKKIQKRLLNIDEFQEILHYKINNNTTTDNFKHCIHHINTTIFLWSVNIINKLNLPHDISGIILDFLRIP